MIYGILEVLQESRIDICSWFDRGVAANMTAPFDTRREVARLVQLEVFQEQENQLRFCSPLHAMWFEAKRQKGTDIHGEALSEPVGNGDQPRQTSIPEDPASEIRRRCDHLKDLKSQLRLAQQGQNQIFQNVEMPEEWANACIVVRTRDAWDVFIKALRNLFIEDMRSRLDSWGDRRRYPDLNTQLHSIRLRRNYVEHPASAEGRNEEERCCLIDIGKRFPTCSDDWLILQLSSLDHLTKALKATIEQIARA
jgi:hypothetical protein